MKYISCFKNVTFTKNNYVDYIILQKNKVCKAFFDIFLDDSESFYCAYIFKNILISNQNKNINQESTERLTQ